MKGSELQFDTRAVHAGVEPDPTTGAIMTPIYQTSTYAQTAPGEHKGYEYARTQNPTREALQQALASLEEAQHGLCFASGMAAVDALMKLLKPGDEIIATNDLYGGTYRIFKRVFEPFGLRFKFLDMSNIEVVSKAFSQHTRMVWLETPTNPVLRVYDIEQISDLTHSHGAKLVVDNTFSSPALQNPIRWGADFVMHSATKYLGGHSDVVLGAILTQDSEDYEQLKFLQNTCGAVPGPQDCFLVLRGLKTLGIRMQRHCENGDKVAKFLSNHPKVGQVRYPGLQEHEGYDIARKQMQGFGGMISFTTKGDTLEEALEILKRTQIFTLAESLGGVESLIGHPATMTHAAIPESERIAAGLSNSLIRLSVGIENAEDLMADLDQALSAI